MKKFIILLSLLILLPLVATSKPLIPIMKTLFTDVTGTVPDAEEIARKAELFRQQTGIVLFIGKRRLSTVWQILIFLRG